MTFVPHLRVPGNRKVSVSFLFLKAQCTTRGRAHPTPDKRLVFHPALASEGDPKETIFPRGRQQAHLEGLGAIFHEMNLRRKMMAINVAAQAKTISSPRHNRLGVL
jgi:hypothetical protein